jgi:hypothetical protein
VAYQRQTADDCGCLPVLLYLLGMETTPELKRRLADTFEVVYRNALSGKHHSVEEAPRVAVTETTSDFDRSYRLLAAEVIPGMEKFGLGGVARQEYASRIAGMLQQLAITACNETGNMALATNAFATALELPCSPEVRAGLEKLGRNCSAILPRGRKRGCGRRPRAATCSSTSTASASMERGLPRPRSPPCAMVRKRGPRAAPW